MYFFFQNWRHLHGQRKVLIVIPMPTNYNKPAVLNSLTEKNAERQIWAVVRAHFKRNYQGSLITPFEIHHLKATSSVSHLNNHIAINMADYFEQKSKYPTQTKPNFLRPKRITRASRGTQRVKFSLSRNLITIFTNIHGLGFFVKEKRFQGQTS